MRGSSFSFLVERTLRPLSSPRPGVKSTESNAPCTSWSDLNCLPLFSAKQGSRGVCPLRHPHVPCMMHRWRGWPCMTGATQVLAGRMQPSVGPWQLESTKPPPAWGQKGEGDTAFRFLRWARMAGLLGVMFFTRLRDLAGHQVIRATTYSGANTILNVPREASLSLSSRTTLGKPSLAHSGEGRLPLAGIIVNLLPGILLETQVLCAPTPGSLLPWWGW